MTAFSTRISSITTPRRSSSPWKGRISLDGGGMGLSPARLPGHLDHRLPEAELREELLRPDVLHGGVEDHARSPQALEALARFEHERLAHPGPTNTGIHDDVVKGAVGTEERIPVARLQGSVGVADDRRHCAVVTRSGRAEDDGLRAVELG